ncbi:MAG: IS1595 family transposase [Desulfobacteraceae bacterium]|nr:MAG: IS1595 family transposase [Desulfobacteraceae bacterium]
MNLENFETLINKEKTARAFFVKSCWKNYRRFCVKCGGYKTYRIAGKRYRCKRCQYTFHDFSGRWLNALRITSKQWLWIIKLFELELSASKISKQIGLSYPTTLKALHIIRLAILSHSQEKNDFLDGDLKLHEMYDGSKHEEDDPLKSFDKVPIFSIREREGIVKVEVVKNMEIETLFRLPVKTVRRGIIVYTDKFEDYDSLMFCGYRHLKTDHKKRFASGKVYINGVEGFWSYAKERLIKYHGISIEKFPLYLKEMEFRYNNRHQSIYSILVKYLTNLVPNPL